MKKAIISVVKNIDLYHKTSTTFPESFDKIVVDGTNGLYGIEALIFSIEHAIINKYDWVVFIDEDCILLNEIGLDGLIFFMSAKDFHFCGVPDGGVVSHRLHNPAAFNLSFIVLNLSVIKSKWNKRNVLLCQNITESELDHVFKNIINYEFNLNSLYEPYYCFFFWLNRNGFRSLDLRSRMLTPNSLANYILNYDNSDLALHAWKSRFYSKSNIEKDRINNILLPLLDKSKSHINYQVWSKKSYLKRIINYWFK